MQGAHCTHTRHAATVAQSAPHPSPLPIDGADGERGRAIRSAAASSPPLQGEGWVGMGLLLVLSNMAKATVRSSCCCADSAAARDRRIPRRFSPRAISPWSARKRRDCRGRRGHVGDVGAIGIYISQGRAAARAKSALNAGRGCVRGGFAADEGEIRRSKYCPPEGWCAGCPAATAAVAHHQRRRSSGHPVANRAAQAAAFVNCRLFHSAMSPFVSE